MSAAKLEIATSTHTAQELAPIVSEFFTSALLVRRTQLYGGYSGSSYLLELNNNHNDDSAQKYVLKVSNGYSANHAELMCRTAYHLGECGYKDICLPIPKAGLSTQQQDTNTATAAAAATTTSQQQPSYHQFVSTKERDGIPAFLLTCVEGQAADRVMRQRPELATTILRGIGGGLARMHAAAVFDRNEACRLGLRWYEIDGGCCDVQDQVSGKILEMLEGWCEQTSCQHEFLPFYRQELEALHSEMKLAKEGKLPHGFTHGDPFADNVLVDPESGELSAFIDIEDVCIGPLLFDLACSAIGCCFTKSKENSSKYPQILDMSLLEALLKGYCGDRNLQDVEREHFVAFMRLTLLCNCSWRFVKFNIKSSGNNEIPQEAKDSYLELQHRIEYLHDPAVVEKIDALLKEL